MYLKSLRVVNFRRLQDVTLDFQPGINVVVGENNSGKSAVIDALRHIFSLGSERREIYYSEDDFHHDDQGQIGDYAFEIHATFGGLTPDQQAHFSVCLSPSLGEDVAQLHMRV